MDHRGYMNQAIELASQSKCASMSVGCVIVADKKEVVSNGVNGTPSGYTNCNAIWNCSCPEHSAWSEKHEIHAEMNAILKLAVSEHKKFKVVDVYTTHSPCDNCTKHILGLMIKQQVKVDHIIYNEVYYRVTPESLELQRARCADLGVKLVHIDEINK